MLNRGFLDWKYSNILRFKSFLKTNSNSTIVRGHKTDLSPYLLTSVVRISPFQKRTYLPKILPKNLSKSLDFNLRYIIQQNFREISCHFWQFLTILSWFRIKKMSTISDVFDREVVSSTDFGVNAYAKNNNLISKIQFLER